MKKYLLFLLSIILCLAITACGSDVQPPLPDNGDATANNTPASSEPVQSPQPEETPISQTESGGAKHLIAYFSRVGNTDFPDDVDAISSASLLIKNGEIVGNTQYIAMLIQKNIGGDLFLIETAEKYPTDYDETDEQGRIENRDRPRPELASHVENLDEYDTVFIGFPNWYYDMPMAVYSFLEAHDLSGKTIVPFCTSGGGGFSDSVSAIQELQPEATIITNGFTATHSRVDDVTSEDVETWLTEIGFAN